MPAHRHENPASDALAEIAAGEPRPPCVAVVGPHHGGAGLTRAALTLAGLAPARTRGLESFDERLLSILGGSWDRPPSPLAGWESGPAVAGSRDIATPAFRLAFEGEQGAVLWGTPVTSLLLPFWRSSLDRPVVGILSWRDPLASASALGESRGVSTALGIALWDRYLRAALEGLRGLPVFVSHPGEVVRDPRRFMASLVELLRWAGVKAGDLDPQEVSELVATGSAAEARSASLADEGLEMLPATRSLVEAVSGLAGPHREFDPPPPAPADDWVEEILAARSDAASSWSGLLWAAGTLEERAGKRIADRLGLPTPDSAEGDGHVRSYPLNATEDRASYRAWLKGRGRPSKLPSREEHLRSPAPLVAATPVPAGRPRFSIVVPVWRPPMWVLERCVWSVLQQTYGSFELCMCDDASGDPALTAALRSFAALDPRIKVTTSPQNGGISAATNGALALASGEYVVLLDNDDELVAHALEAMSAAIDADPHADVLYSDEDKTNELGELFEPACKPDWSPDTLLSCAYMCHLFVIRRSLVEELGGLRSEFDGSQDYDLMLRSTEKARSIVHVPDLLYHWRIISGSAAGDTSAKPWAYAAGKRALESAMERRGEAAVVDSNSPVPGLYHVRRGLTGEPLVSIIVPFRDEPALLTQCVESLCEAPGYDRFELLLVDNGSVLPETATLLDQLSEHPRVLLLEEPGPFNWSAINNDAAAASNGDLLLFMNNDVEASTEGWLLPMVEHAQRPDVGAVGARLLYPSRTIQHAGVVLGMCNAAAHVLQDLPEDHPGYLTWAWMTRNCTAVTGACMMTPRGLFEQLGGFDADLPVAFNDIDYCLRLRQQGKLVVYTPLAELVHHESRTRGHTDDAVELPRFLARWAEEIAAGDPYYNPNLSAWRQECQLSSPEEDVEWRKFRSKLARLSTR
jgi:GT2 family glycosyltransferase